MKRLIILFVCIFSLYLNSAQATHIMGGDLTYRCISGNTYELELTIFRDCNGIPLGAQNTVTMTSPTCGSMTINVPLAPGSPEVVTPICSSFQDACNGGSGPYGVQKYYYTATVTLTGCWASASDITFSWASCCRNNAITTLASSGGSSTYFYAELDATQNCNTSPQFLNDPLFFAEINAQITYTDGGFDPDGDSLVFSLMDCLESNGTPVSYAASFSGTNPLSTTSGVTIDPATGELVFKPNMLQAGVVCVRIEEYRNGAKIGEVTRDIYIATVSGQGNIFPILSGINGTASSSGTTGDMDYIGNCATDTVTFTIDAYDANAGQSISWETINLPNGATFTADTINNVGTFFWVPSPSDFGQIHGFGLKVWDDACPVEGQAMNVYSIDLTNSYNITVSSSNNNPNFGDTITLSTTMPDTSCSVTWLPTTGLSCTNCPNPTVVANANTTYTATVNCAGCTYSGSVSITVNQQLNGTITTNSGAPLANSTVNIYDKNGGLLMGVPTDANGDYIAYLSVDSVSVHAIPNVNSYPLQLPTFYQNGALVGLSGMTNVSFSTDLAQYQLSGIISRADGNPLNNSIVVMIDSNYTIEAILPTDSIGYYSYSTYTSHLYLLAIPDSALHSTQMKTYYQSTPLVQSAILVALQPVTTVNFSTLQFAQMTTPTSNQTIGGVVLEGSETGDPEVDVRLLLTNANQDIVGEDVTDADGSFSFEGVDTGTYRIWVDQVDINNALTNNIPVSMDSTYQLDSLTCFLHSDYLEILIPFFSSNKNQLKEISKIELYPNPATEDAYLRLNIDQPSSISIQAFDATGKSIGKIVNDRVDNGLHEYNLKTILKDYSGICIITIQTDSGVVSRRLVYMK